MEIKSFGSICSGVGMQEMAIKRVFKDIEMKYFSEIDKYAIKSYQAIHGDIRNLGDFTQATDIPYVDFVFASTPCQDFSVAGKQAGFEGMRGTLTFEWVKMLSKLKLENKLPKMIGFENVPAIMNKKFIDGFNIFKAQLEELGYNLFVDRLNAKDYGIPQNRNRVFMIGFLEKVNFEFPEKFELELRLKDILEEEVEEKFYLSEAQIKNITNSTFCQNTRRIQKKDWCDTLCARDYKDPKCVAVAASRGRNPLDPSDRTKGSPTVQRLEINRNGTSNCLTTVQKDNLVIEKYPIKIEIENLKHQSSTLRIRKLTPKECWRLMGIKDSDFEKAQELNSNSQLYKQAGNGIVVDVLEYIFREIKNKNRIKESE